jgi:hypothetical protein
MRDGWLNAHEDCIGRKLAAERRIMLTLEQIAEGRRLVAVGTAEDATVSQAAYAEDWLMEHAAELLDAAERVARQEAYAAAPDGYDRADTSLGRLDPHMVKTMGIKTDAQLAAGETHCVDDEPKES